MKIKFLRIISAIICCVLLLFIAGCKDDDTKNTDDDNVINKSVGLRITLSDSNNNELYDNRTLQPEILSLDEVYYLTVEVTGGAAFIPYDSINVKYDKEYIEVSALDEPYYGEVYSLKGLSECNDCIIEFFQLKYYLDSNGSWQTDGDLRTYCSIAVSFS